MIKLAVEDYLYFGIKDPKACNPEEFLSSYNYLFVTKSSDSSTWQSQTEPGITNEQMKLMCFDVHYDCVALNKIIKKPVLLSLLKKKRESVVTEHLAYMTINMNHRRRIYCRLAEKTYRPISDSQTELKKSFIEPTEESIGRLYFGE